jgi:hypothetical protein
VSARQILRKSEYDKNRHILIPDCVAGEMQQSPRYAVDMRKLELFSAAYLFRKSVDELKCPAQRLISASVDVISEAANRGLMFEGDGKRRW